MPIFDPEPQQLVLRVVYDGPLLAGKRTNLEQLGSSSSASQHGGLRVPVELDGGTLFFDWLPLDGGLVQGHSLRYQLVRVPAPEGRRLRILESADVVVFVCSSAQGAPRRARAMLAGLADHRRRGLPFVLQANKQDLETAMAPEAVRAALQLGSEVPVVGACARTGLGVRKTCALAMCAAAAKAERMLRRGDLARRQARARPTSEFVTALTQGPNDVRAFHLEKAELARQPATGHDDNDEDEAPPSRPRWRHHGAEDPPLPRHDVPSDCIWPALSGRKLLRELSRTPLTRHEVVADGRGHAVVFKASHWCLRTSRTHQYASRDAARTALASLARQKSLLGELLAPGTTLSIQEAPDNSCWIWTVAPRMAALNAEIEGARRQASGAALAEALARYAHGVARLLALEARGGVCLESDPESFACLGESVFYVAEPHATRNGSVAQVLLGHIEAYALPSGAIAAFVRSLEDELARHLTAHDLIELELAASFDRVAVRSEEVRMARDRLSAQVAAMTNVDVKD